MVPSAETLQPVFIDRIEEYAMNTSGLLDQLLKAGQKALQDGAGSAQTQKSGGGLGDLLGSVMGGGSNNGAAQGGLGDLLGSVMGGGSSNNAAQGGQGGLGDVLGGLGGLLSGADKNATIAAGAGLLGMLLGGKGAPRGGVNKALAYGGLAVLGMQAYKAYTAWQAKQQAAGTQVASQLLEPRTLDRVSATEAEQHSQAILRAIIAAAKSDGHIDEREQQMIQGEMGKLDQDPELQRWLSTELNKPLDPAEVASAASTPEMAAEMYMASKLVINDEQYMERAYLDELARHLKLDAGLRAELDAHIG